MSHTIKRRIRCQDESDAMAEGCGEHPRFSYASMAWVAVGTAVLGAGTTLYGANKQSKAQAASDASNRAAIEQADRGAWNNYLMQRGLYAGNAPTGTIPGMTPGGAVNTRLPLWATIQQQNNPGPLRVVRRGTAAPNPTLSVNRMGGT